MSKPIGSEWSVMLISILFLLNYLLLWQLGSGASFDDRIEEVVGSGSLPDDEVSALRLLSKNLLSKDTMQLTLTYPICSPEKHAEIRCDYCHSIKNQSVCSVTIINLPSKNLDGSIDPSIDLFEKLEALNLFNNQLSGEIPATLGNLQYLKILNLSSNSLTGSIPPNLTKLHNLEYLIARQNKHPPANLSFAIR